MRGIRMRILLVYIHEDEKLKACLESLKKFSPEIPVDLIKADPKKTNVSEEEYQKYFNSEKFIEDVMIWHPDMIATENWYEKLKKYYDSFDVIGCKILYPDGIVNHYGGAIRKDGVGCHPHQFTLNIGLNEPLSCAYVTGPSMIVKKKVWDKIKSYDFQFTYYIDADFCFQARANGFSVGVIPVELIHSEGEDILKRMPQWKTAQMQKENYDKFTAKWMQNLGELR